LRIGAVGREAGGGDFGFASFLRGGSCELTGSFESFALSGAADGTIRHVVSP
jgi:hypothetical protein